MSELCFEECSHLSSAAGDKPTSSLLPGEAVTHYLIPFTDVVAKFMEVLEVGEFTGSRETNSVADPGSGAGVKIKIRIRDPESLETIFGFKILKFFDAEPESF